ncbi:alpha/beta fold hydrolase [Simiduia aestuariiviva]|uniref:Pimeloyl-ACP methyl ester carboxylesterase n=1 Tax=Simiduia aestuariiviva TaxID=1510459 RepID=A0A839ULB0_9GAMM|nr:alpha/beta hydrolase [Simiduia aestuariiviva]MBB3168632.1 pimeloyl-ACP methyl ester carboxylesterase [Simiduia aestuariiviva]
MTAPQEHLFQLSGERTLAARIWHKRDAPVLLALHGWLDNCASFNRLAPQLDATVVALDLAGHGHSYHRPSYSPYHLWDDIIDVGDVIKSLSLTQVGLLGHSRGAIIATLFAAAQSESVEQLLLLDGLLPEPINSDDAPAQMRKAMSALARDAQRTFPVYPDLAAAAQVRLQGMFPLSQEAALEMAGRGSKPVQGGVTWRVDPKLLTPSMVKLNAEQIFAFARAISMPASLVLASEGMPKLFPGLHKVLEKLDNINQQLMVGSHHLHMEQQATEVAKIFNQHIREQCKKGALSVVPRFTLDRQMERA